MTLLNRVDRLRTVTIACVICLMVWVVSRVDAQAERATRVYLGTYTNGPSEGIYTCRLDQANGKLADLRLAAATTNPSFLAIHPEQDFVYAVNEVAEFKGQPTGSVTAFQIAEDGSLVRQNAQSSGGRGPCHLVVDTSGRHVLVANYGSGSVCVLRIADDGSLGLQTGFSQHVGSGPNKRRQEAPHAHSINLDKQNRFCFAADLGLDQVLIYRYYARSGRIEAHDPAFVALPAGGGPRHFAMHPLQRFAYVNNELLSSVTAFSYDPQAGRLKMLDTWSTLPAGFQGNNSTAEIQVHPSGRFLYCSNRGHDSLVVMSIDADSGRLTYLENVSTGGRTPRNFAIDPSGRWLLVANQATHDVVVFRIDLESGGLQPTGNRLSVPAPVCIKFSR